MSDYHKEKVQESISHMASDFINREASHASLITVTKVELTDDIKECTIFVSIFPENKSEAGLDFLKRQRSEFKKFVKKHSALGHIPFFDFEIDMGEKSRQRVEEISLNL